MTRKRRNWRRTCEKWNFQIHFIRGLELLIGFELSKTNIIHNWHSPYQYLDANLIRHKFGLYFQWESFISLANFSLHHGYTIHISLIALPKCKDWILVFPSSAGTVITPQKDENTTETLLLIAVITAAAICCFDVFSWNFPVFVHSSVDVLMKTMPFLAFLTFSYSIM